MADPDYQRLLELHEELRRISAAGIPLALGEPADASRLDAQLQTIAAEVSIAMGNDVSVKASLRSRSDFPERYRGAALQWLEGTCPTSALERLYEPLRQQQSELHWTRSVLWEAILVLLILAPAVVMFFYYYLPRLEAFHHASRIPENGLINTLQQARVTARYWGPVVVLITIVAIVGLSTRGGSRRLLWLFPSGRRYLRHFRHAERCRELLQQGNVGELMATVPNAPPLIHWAFTDAADDSQRRRDNLLRAEVMYQTLAQHAWEQWKIWFPLLATVLFCGTLVCLYALALFVPLIQTLQEVSVSAQEVTGG